MTSRDILTLIILTETKNFVPFILADTAMEIENLSTEKECPWPEPYGTQILTSSIGLYAEISASTSSWYLEWYKNEDEMLNFHIHVG